MSNRELERLTSAFAQYDSTADGQKCPSIATWVLRTTRQYGLPVYLCETHANTLEATR